jgi:predicted  nucleic acid-binding Zn-ribbon protein
MHYGLGNCGPYTGSGDACPNEGEWPQVFYQCPLQFSDALGDFCYEGRTRHDVGCVMRRIHFIDFWFQVITGDGDWRVDFFNFYIAGNQDGDIIFNGTVTRPGVFVMPLNTMTYVAIVLDYDTTCETTATLYINGTYVANATYDNNLDISPFTSLYVFDIVGPIGTKVYFMGAHVLIPDEERIFELYTLGSNRSVDTEICFNFTSQLYSDCVSTVENQTTTILLLTGDLNNCTNLTDSQQEEIVDLNKELNNCTNLTDTQQEEIIDLNKELNNCTNKTEAQQEEIENLTEGLNNCTNLTDAQQEEIENLTEGLNNCTNETETQQVQITALTTSLDTCTNTTIYLNESLKECNETVEDLKKNITDLINVTIILEKIIEYINETIMECEDTVEQLMMENYVLKQNLSECVNATRELEMQLQQLYNTMWGWIIAFIVVASILLIFFLSYLIWLFWFLPVGYFYRRRRRKEPEETETSDILLLRTINPSDAGLFFK